MTKVRTCATVKDDGTVCGNPLAPRRKVCDECTLQSIKAANARLKEQRAAGNAPKTRPVTEYLMPQIAVENWEPKPKPAPILTAEEQLQIDKEARERDARDYKKRMADFGLTVREGGVVAGKARSYTKKEIAEIERQCNYQPPQKHEGFILPHLRGDYVF